MVIWIDFVAKNWSETGQLGTKTQLSKHSLCWMISGSTWEGGLLAPSSHCSNPLRPLGSESLDKLKFQLAQVL